MRSVVFDTQALLALYLGEAGSLKVEEELDAVSRKEAKGFLNIVSLAELHYILRRNDVRIAEEKERNLRSFGVRIVPVIYDSPLWKNAAAIKASISLSLADAFAASTALMHKATLLTGGDIEFDQVRGLKIERVG